MRKLAFALSVLVLLSTAPATAQTVGLLQFDAGTSPGYTLFSGLTWPVVYLIDNNGFMVHSWPTTHVSGNTNYILPNGDLLRCADPGGNTTFIAGGDGGLIQQRDWDNNIVWEFTYSDTMVRHHHDIEPLPNGNVLVIAWEYKSQAEAVQAGRDPALLANGELWPEHIIELQPDGLGSATIVWKWHVWDHLIQDFDNTKDNFGVVADHPELIDINYGRTSADWLHANSIDYRADFDQILLGVPWFNEIWIIDHSTTTEEAAGHTGGNSGMGGDILYRWGNPAAYQAGTVADQKWFNQHDAGFIDPGLPGAGNIIVYNNGNGRPAGNYSTLEEVVTTIDGSGNYPQPASGVPHGPAAQFWIYDPATQFYSGGLSSASRLPNGNTLAAVGQTGEFFEIDPTETRVWTYETPVDGNGPILQGQVPAGNRIFRAERYPLDYAGFVGRDLSPLGPIEIPVTSVGPLSGRGFALHPSYPNPTQSSSRIAFELPATSQVQLDILDVRGRRVDQLVNARLTPGNHAYTWQSQNTPAGVYFYRITVGDQRETRKLLVVR